MRRILLRGGRVLLHTTVGGVLVVAGIVMLLTPGPGIVTVILGLAILAREYDWAARLNRRVLSRVRDASTAARARLAARRSGGGAPAPSPGLHDLHPSEDADDDASGRMRPAS